MPNQDTIIDLAGTIIMLRQIVDSKVRELEEANKRIEYLQSELEHVLKEEDSEVHTH